jgi:hypothetical protein
MDLPRPQSPSTTANDASTPSIMIGTPARDGMTTTAPVSATAAVVIAARVRNANAIRIGCCPEICGNNNSTAAGMG